MKEESFLDSAGPVTIVVLLTVVVVVASWVMVRASGDWGKTTPPSVASAPADSSH